MKENNDKKQFTDPIQPAFEDYKKEKFPFFELESGKDFDMEFDSDDDCDIDFNLDEDDDLSELEHIENYRLQFIELPKILRRFEIVNFDKKDLEVNLIIEDCAYDEIDKIEFKHGKINEFDYTLLDFSKIKLECPQALYMLALKDTNKGASIFTFEISENEFCLGKLEKGLHNNMGFYNKLSHEEFIDLCISKV